MASTPPVQLLEEFESPAPTTPNASTTTTHLVQSPDENRSVARAPDEQAPCGHYEKYTNLEDAAYEYFRYSRDDFSLHFHAASHNRCERRLNARSWDQGAYFAPDLLSEGVFRVVPHFTRRRFEGRGGHRGRGGQRGQAGQIRDAQQVNKNNSLTNKPSLPKRADNEPSQSASQDVTANKGKTPHTASPASSLEPGNNTTTTAPHSLPPGGQLTLSAKTSNPLSQSPSPNPQGRNQFTPQTQNKASPRRRLVPPLPPSLNSDTWSSAFKTAFEKHQATSSASEKTREPYARRMAHSDLIQGQYGVRAAMACDRCSDREVECRTYHPDCYKWVVEDKSGVELLGWRCGGCRRGRQGTTACDARWE